MKQPRERPREDAPPGEVLQHYAQRLNRRWWRWPLLGPSYHLFAGALFWADEYPPWWRLPELEDALRVLWYYRTGLILGQPREYGEYWELGRQLFPRWVGFHPSRCRPERRLIAFYRAAHIASIRCLAEVEREFDGSEAEPGTLADQPRD